jgi:hypothetical protein
MTHARTRIAACLAGLCITGCAGLGVSPASPEGPGTARTPAGQTLAPQAAMESVALGRSTRSDVAASLGQAIVVPFDSGYEVWVYRWAGGGRTPHAGTELVVLFDPSGVAAKRRLRWASSAPVTTATHPAESR